MKWNFQFGAVSVERRIRQEIDDLERQRYLDDRARDHYASEVAKADARIGKLRAQLKTLAVVKEDAQ